MIWGGSSTLLWRGEGRGEGGGSHKRIKYGVNSEESMEKLHILNKKVHDCRYNCIFCQIVHAKLEYLLDKNNYIMIV